VAENEWKIAKAGGACSLCAAALGANAPGGAQPYFSALFQKPEGLVRQDFCTACFQGKRPADVYYFWKAAPQSPDADAKKRAPVVDIDFVLDFFKRLEGDNAPQRVAFRYILALMLTRKKLLVFEQKKKDAEGRDVQLYREKRGGVSHQVVEPSLTEEEITNVSAELGTLLGLTPAPAAAAAGAPTASGDGTTAEAAGDGAGVVTGDK